MPSSDEESRYARVATVDREGNVYVALALDDEGSAFAVWSFSRDGTTRWWTELEEMSAAGIAVDGSVVRVVDSDACVALSVADGKTVERVEQSCDARIVRCPDGSFLVVSAPNVSRVASAFPPWKDLPIFPKQPIEKPGLLSSFIGGERSERDTSVRGDAAACMPRGDLLVYDPEEKALVRYSDEGDVVSRVEVPFGVDEIQAVGEDAYILATGGDLFVLHDGRVDDLEIEDVAAFAVDPEAGIWVFHGGEAELVSLR